MKRFFLQFLHLKRNYKVSILVLLSLVFTSLFVLFLLIQNKQTKIVLLHFDKFTLPINITIELNPSSYDISTLKQEIDRILNEDALIYNYYNSESEISKLNRADLFEKLTLSRKLYDVLQQSKMIHSLLPTFDPGVVCLEKALSFNANINNDELRQACYRETGIMYLELLDNLQVYKTRNIQIDLGAIEKGKFMEDILHYLNQQSITSGIIEIGGDLLTFGKRNWKIGVISPQNKKISYTLLVNNKAIATSGNYERNFKKGDIFKNHIVNPYLMTSETIETPKSVTVVGNDPALVDALATGLFLLTPEEAKNIKSQLLPLGKFDFFYLIGSNLKLEKEYSLFDIEKTG